ncbi:PAS domain S-box protein [Chitinivibrio alkaliphilus]|uniref:histidine kinase n=1 Tax=Chitinivibrio alkaliphilus ACht1 TaxID=1313304 RepID=U7DBD4_9BACT|nr:PAS domain S-box protein [Chitinivibrio alkaliphilus]ERP31735.1 PAS/PAC sensor hybrid histidine kinase [Chitinivibrio alkaliphilus ACht1]
MTALNASEVSLDELNLPAIVFSVENGRVWCEFCTPQFSDYFPDLPRIPEKECPADGDPEIHFWSFLRSLSTAPAGGGSFPYPGGTWGYEGALTHLSENRFVFCVHGRETLENAEESEELELLRLAIAAREDGVWDWKIPSNRFYFSPRWKSILGYTEEEIPNTFLGFLHLVHPADQPTVQQAINAYFQGSLSRFSLEFRMKRRDGSYAWILSRGVVVRDARGKPRRFSGIHSDISEYKAVQDQLHKLHEAVEQSNASIIITDVQGRIEYVNPYFTTLTGYTFSEVKGKSPRFLKAKRTDERKKYELLWKTIGSGQTWQGEFQNQKKNGEIYWEKATISPILRQDEVVGYIAVKDNITRDKEITQELRRAETQMRSYIEKAPYGIAVVDAQGRFIVCNHEMSRITGYGRRKLHGISFAEVLPDTLENSPLLSFQTCEPEEEISEEVPLRQASGEIIWVEIRAYKTLQDEGILFFRDITKVRAYEKKIISAKIEAEQANSVKNSFLENMTHEFRTPLSGIVGFADLLQKTSLTEDQRTYLSYLQESAQLLNTVISDVLHFSRLCGKGQLGPTEWVVPERFIQECCDDVSALCEEKGLSLTVSLSSSMPPSIAVHTTELRKVMRALLENAIKFTSEGGITLSLRNVQGAAGKGLIEFVVSDTGCGISKDVHKAVFDPFVQEDITKTRRYGGTGLGLAIVRQTLLGMKSDINVSSTPGEGSSFYFFLPCEYGEARICMDEPAVLCVGKKPPAIRLFCNNHAIPLSFEKSPMRAIHLLQEEHFSHVFVDSESLPMNIRSFLRGIERHVLYERELSRAIIFPPGALPNEALLKKYRCDHFLTAPVSEKALARIIAPPRKPQAEPSSALPHREEHLSSIQEWYSKKQFLVVDDNKVNRVVLKSVLAQLLPHTIVLAASSGEGAVEVYRDNPCCCIFMDIQMSGIDGYEAAARIRKGSSGDAVILIGLTAGHISSSAKTHLDMILEKPVQRQELIRILYELRDAVPFPHRREDESATN